MLPLAAEALIGSGASAETAGESGASPGCKVILAAGNAWQPRSYVAAENEFDGLDIPGNAGSRAAAIGTLIART
jgi:hypothetical protein